MKTETAAERRDRWEEERKEHERFKARLFKKHEVENNPKREACYKLAWDYGHSSGFSEVESYFSDLVELIK